MLNQPCIPRWYLIYLILTIILKQSFNYKYLTERKLKLTNLRTFSLITDKPINSTQDHGISKLCSSYYSTFHRYGRSINDGLQGNHKAFPFLYSTSKAESLVGF